ncbi:MAG: TIGR03618 family F420-dependent PPOX class oxidoreductase [Actinomycetota bacterium]
MRTDLTIEDLGGFLDEPVIAVLSTVRQDGSILLSPVWHEWRDGGFNVWTGANDVKSRHLRREPRASILVAESSYPLRGAEVRGTARIVPEDAFETAIRIAGRYLGPEKGEAYVRKVGGNDVTIRLEPGELRAWDFVDEEEGMSPRGTGPPPSRPRPRRAAAR